MAAQVPRPALAVDVSAETRLKLRLPASPDERHLGTWASPTPRSILLFGVPYIFGMVLNPGPSHKCHGAPSFLRLPSDAQGMTAQ
jgi:hypothetical protein